MNQLYRDLIWKLEEVKRIKNVKEFYEELTALEELQLRSILNLMKAKLLVETVVKGETISKEKLSSDDVRCYRIKTVDSIREEFKTANVQLIEEQGDVDRYSKKKKSKEPKKSTVQETYELWIQRKTIKEIAAIRKLTPQTISGHLAKLIETQTIALTDVLPEDKINALAEAFKGFKGEALGELKEKYGDEFTWDELKMYKASL